VLVALDLRFTIAVEARPDQPAVGSSSAAHSNCSAIRIDPNVVSPRPLLRSRSAPGKLGRPWGMGHAIARSDLDVSVVATSAAHAEKRVVLVIGNAA
jgi:hypothetical protein